MGRKSRIKKDRRAEADFTAALTACEGTWLERPPAAEEITRISTAQHELGNHRKEATALSADEQALAPLHFDDWMIEQVLDQFGEPPVVEDEADTAFSDYLRVAVHSIGSSRVRRAISSQVRRFIPAYVEAGQITEGLVIDYNSYVTVMSDANTPLLVQMLVGGLSRWYDEHEEEESAVEQPAE